MISGGDSRMDVSPAPRRSTPFSNASSTMRSRTFDTGALLCLSFTISTASMSPFPRTSPTIGYFWIHVDIRCFSFSPTLDALRMPSRSITSMLANAAAMATGLPPKVDACDLCFAEAIGVRVRNMCHSGNERGEAATLLRLRRCERERSHGASVEGAIEGDEPLALGVIASQLERALHGLGSRVPKIELMRTGHGRDPAEAFGELRHGFVVEVSAGHVDQLTSLALNGAHHVRMTVARGCDGDAGGKVVEFVSINVFDDRSAATLCNQRIRSVVAGRN